MRLLHYRFSLLAGLILCCFVSLLPFQRCGNPAFAETIPSAQQNNPSAKQAACHRLIYNGESYIICRANPEYDQIKLFLTDENGRALHYFRNVRSYLARCGKQAVFLMNAGMYHKDFSPVGLFVSDGNQPYPANINSGAGNFFLKPNGVFYIANDKAGVMETEAFLRSGIKPQLATQSGPMLILHNKIHPKFIPNSKFREYRNGVGVNARGEVFFAISEQKVNFDDFAHMFRDALHCPNALFLDGSISSIYAPALHRADWFYALGPIIGVVERE